MVLMILVVIRISVEGGATSKISKARFGECRLTITPPEFWERPREKNFQKKKMAGEDPPDPLVVDVHILLAVSLIDLARLACFDVSLDGSTHTSPVHHGSHRLF
jgi:hypothetical protein